MKYRLIRDDEDRKEQNRQAQARFREKKFEKKAKKCPPLPGQGEYERALKAGASDEELGKIVERNLPAPVAGNAVTNGEGEKTSFNVTEARKAVAKLVELSVEPEAEMCVECGECAPESGTICNECRETRLSD